MTAVRTPPTPAHEVLRESSPHAPPESVRVTAFGPGGRWWDCVWKSDTLCFPNGMGPVGKDDFVWVVGDHPAANAYAENVLKGKFKFRAVGVGDKDWEPDHA